ncbi:hypothetical protein AALO_G00290580 [Alosa alosa]|uniref:Protein FAM207A n=1 Tax=Alosa alosa TaxID=278164 RepID=A0AAV6FK12_9TELE|nr:protein FAM207A isoform X1 [Alosa sapidissima]XP_048090810.1 protein FAM207A isoform X1 [Alosa alosa]KAG5261966.1 hypothetical protein AALO_G00290580 [Alosa alosa]
MVGKIKRIRQKLHQDAVKVDHSQSGLEKPPLPAEVKGLVLPGISKGFDLNQRTNKSDNNKGLSLKSSFPAGIFAGTKITPEALVQTLKYDEPSKSTASAIQTGGGGEKKQQSKKEKMKDRRERWLNKISAIKLAKEQQVAQARRKATPVVGDMRPLVDALPELSLLTATTKPTTTATRTKAKAGEKKKPSSVNFSKMKPAQKRKLVETETAWFSQALKNPTLKANPLAAITDHLRKRLKQEEEQS